MGHSVSDVEDAAACDAHFEVSASVLYRLASFDLFSFDCSLYVSLLVCFDFMFS